ncbi:SPFH domain-containing protein [Empedobacter brevis]|uniref:SPFH domain-containing protein n=1 Tax=Empedobacter brevis TaxID=247 RepID=A0AAJ1QGK6_9FLAO|nr:SPFH domain-containing protein [Empedobacter brevis]MDM1073649.1 SPFH domain-containing protein [Empedobacter brevis]
MGKKILAIVGLLSLFISSCSRVEPNYVGVVMENYGKNGKSDFTTEKGRVWTMSPGKELFQVPLFEQRGNFEKSLTLKAADNTEFKASPVYSFRVVESKAIDVVFNNKQLKDGDFMTSLADNVLEPRMYDLAKEESRKYTTEQLMSNGGSLKFEKDLEGIMQKEFEKRGLELISFSAQLDFSDKVKGKIDARNEVNTNLSVLDQKIQEQKKTNELEQLITEQALIRSKGLTQEILQEKAIQKWNGVLPQTFSGNNLPFVKTIK